MRPHIGSRHVYKVVELWTSHLPNNNANANANNNAPFFGINIKYPQASDKSLRHTGVLPCVSKRQLFSYHLASGRVP